MAKGKKLKKTGKIDESNSNEEKTTDTSSAHADSLAKKESEEAAAKKKEEDQKPPRPSLFGQLHHYFAEYSPGVEWAKNHSGGAAIILFTLIAAAGALLFFGAPLIPVAITFGVLALSSGYIIKGGIELIMYVAFWVDYLAVDNIGSLVDTIAKPFASLSRSIFIWAEKIAYDPEAGRLRYAMSVIVRGFATLIAIPQAFGKLFTGLHNLLLNSTVDGKAFTTDEMMEQIKVNEYCDHLLAKATTATIGYKDANFMNKVEFDKLITVRQQTKRRWDCSNKETKQFKAGAAEIHSNVLEKMIENLKNTMDEKNLDQDKVWELEDSLNAVKKDLVEIKREIENPSKKENEDRSLKELDGCIEKLKKIEADIVAGVKKMPDLTSGIAQDKAEQEEKEEKKYPADQKKNANSMGGDIRQREESKEESKATVELANLSPPQNSLLERRGSSVNGSHSIQSEVKPELK